MQQYIAVMGGGSGEAIPYAENDQLLICEAFTDVSSVSPVLHPSLLAMSQPPINVYLYLLM